MEEILLRHRALIDDAVESLEETTPIDGFLSDLDARVAALRRQEPSFWELRVVDYIHRVVTVELQDLLRNDPAGTDVVCVKEKVRTHLQAQLSRLVDLVEGLEQPNSQKQQEQFLELFWDENVRIATKTLSLEEEHVEGGEDDAPPGEAPYEVITFDDLQFETGSANSAPSPDEIPIILEAFNNPLREDRQEALQRLSQMSALELVHCSTFFVQVVDGLCKLLLDSDREIARQTLQLLYSITSHIEDPIQFLDLYLVVVEWVGASVSSKTLAIASGDVFRECDSAIKAVDAIRFFHLLVCRVPYYWIHFSIEALARVICATVIVLMLDPPARDQKVCRLVEVVGAIDPDAKWFAKWTLKVPSRTQLFASLEETGFLSDSMYAMTRMRPFEADDGPLDRLRTMNTLTILAISAHYQAGYDMLKTWTKLPAHHQHLRRFTQWLGLQKQFRLDAADDDNDKLYIFHRTDSTMKSVHRTEMEDGGPLGEHAITAIVLSTIVTYLFNDSNAESYQSCLKFACQNILLLPSRQEFLAQLFEMVSRCGLEPSSGISATTSGHEELEARDAWFPFRRPKAIGIVTAYVVDAVTKRGLCFSPLVTRKCAHVLGCLVETAISLSSATTRLASALSLGLHGYLDHLLMDATDENIHEGGTLVSKVLIDLQQLLTTTSTPFTMGKALASRDKDAGITLRLLDIVQRVTDRSIHDTVLGLVVAIAQSSASMSQLVGSGLWSKCQDHFLEAWRVTGELDLRVLPLLLLPQATEKLFQSGGVRQALVAIEQTCALDLEAAVALNSALAEAPNQLRPFARSIAHLRAVLGTQYAAHIFSAHDTDLYNFFVRSVMQHEQGVCRTNTQSEDRCTVAYELLTAAAGCIPSMVGFYDLHSPSLSDGDDSLSACSWLAASMAFSLTHVGGYPSRPQPLCHFSSESSREEADHPTTTAFDFTASTACAFDQMMASINTSRRQCEPLDMVMLSQVSWEIIADVENVLNCRHPSRDPTLTVAFGNLIYALVMSGQSKIRSTETRADKEAGATREAPFPTDAERKLMNTYYKAYCTRLGLKATPTMLHVLSKVFGTAAMDCFSCTLLMILDQSLSEQEIIEMLQYCATCPSMYVLWPRLFDPHSERDVPVLLPVAQAAEMILEVEFPEIFTTLRQCHCSVLTLVLRWQTQCYWNYLPWDNIVLMVYLSFLYGVESQVYFFVAVVKHFEPMIRTTIAKNRGDSARAFVETLQTPIEGFRFFAARNFFLTLRSTYHDRVQKILHQ